MLCFWCAKCCPISFNFISPVRQISWIQLQSPPILHWPSYSQLGLPSITPLCSFQGYLFFWPVFCMLYTEHQFFCSAWREFQFVLFFVPNNHMVLKNLASDIFLKVIFWPEFRHWNKWNAPKYLPLKIGHNLVNDSWDIAHISVV